MSLVAWPEGTPSPDPPPEPVAAPVRGWRLWRVQRDERVDLSRQAVLELSAAWERGENPFPLLLPGARLHPLANPTGAWERREDAVCTLLAHASAATVSWAGSSWSPQAGHLAPAKGCHCGLWALKDEADATRTAAEYGLYDGYALGQVELWGKVVEHERGYRGEHGRPVRLRYVSAAADAEEWAAELRGFYGCEVVVEPLARPPTVSLAPMLVSGHGITLLTPSQSLIARVAQQYNTANVTTASGTKITAGSGGIPYRLVSTDHAPRKRNPFLPWMWATLFANVLWQLYWLWLRHRVGG